MRRLAMDGAVRGLSSLLWRGSRLGLMLLLCSQMAVAANNDPVAVVEEATGDILELIDEARGYYDQDPQRFHREVDRLLSPVVDFDSFARGVMGRYASQRYYESLPAAEKAAFRRQVETFRERFKQSLIETYAKGLLRFSGERIETLPLQRGEAGRPQVNVIQHIHGSADKPYVVQYTLRRDRASDWKVRNVIVEGINLGQTYRNQFASAMEQHRGDLDRVIAGWTVQEADGDAEGENG